MRNLIIALKYQQVWEMVTNFWDLKNYRTTMFSTLVFYVTWVLGLLENLAFKQILKILKFGGCFCSEIINTNFTHEWSMI